MSGRQSVLSGWDTGTVEGETRRGYTIPPKGGACVRASGVHGGTCTNDGASKRDIGGSWLAATAAILYDTSAHGTVDCSTADRTKH